MVESYFAIYYERMSVKFYIDFQIIISTAAYFVCLSFQIISEVFVLQNERVKYTQGSKNSYSGVLLNNLRLNK